ncbi:hypothetical protein PALU110988_20075 [Paenibacillus lupini]|nr:hypothetical protein [Paenibacillus lupini]
MNPETKAAGHHNRLPLFFYKAQDRKKVVQFGGHFEIYLTRGENRLLSFRKQLDGNIVAT